MFIISNGFKDTVTCCGRTIFVGNDTEEMEKAIRDYIEEEQYTPTMWYVSDHGNVGPYTLT